MQTKPLVLCETAEEAFLRAENATATLFGKLLRLPCSRQSSSFVNQLYASRPETTITAMLLAQTAMRLHHHAHDWVKYLITQRGLVPDTALFHWALRHNNSSSTCHLILTAAAAMVNEPDTAAAGALPLATALLRCCTNPQSLELVKVLLKHGAKLDIGNDAARMHNILCPHWSVAQNRVCAVRFVVEYHCYNAHHAAVESVVKKWLHVAMQSSSNTEMQRMLLGSCRTPLQDMTVWLNYVENTTATSVLYALLRLAPCKVAPNMFQTHVPLLRLFLLNNTATEHKFKLHWPGIYSDSDNVSLFISRSSSSSSSSVCALVQDANTRLLQRGGLLAAMMHDAGLSCVDDTTPIQAVRRRVHDLWVCVVWLLGERRCGQQQHAASDVALLAVPGLLDCLCSMHPAVLREPEFDTLVKHAERLAPKRDAGCIVATTAVAKSAC